LPISQETLPGVQTELDRLAHLLLIDRSASTIDQQKQRETIFTLANDLTGVRAATTALGAKLDGLTVSVQERSRTNWPLLLSLFAVMPMLAGVLVYVITSQINAAVSPITVRLSQVEISAAQVDRALAAQASLNTNDARDLTALNQQSTLLAVDVRRNADALKVVSDSVAASAFADGVSRTDRTQLNDRLRLVENTVSANEVQNRGQTAEVQARLLEVEQQFANVSNVMNIRAAEQNRVNAMTYEKTHPGERYPDSSFYPTSIFQPVPVPLSTGRK
jgi:hypothetical protein